MSTKLKRAKNPLNCKPIKLSCTPRPLRFGSLAKSTKLSKTKAKPKKSPTDSGLGICLESQKLPSLPPDQFYTSKSASSSSQTPRATPSKTKSDSGLGLSHDLNGEDEELSFSEIERELQFSESSEFDSISETSVSNSSSYTCSESCYSFSSDLEHELDKYQEKVEILEETLEKWDKFLLQNGISRPDFFCRYKEREGLEKALAQFKELSRKYEGMIGGRRKKRSFSLGENWRLRRSEQFKKFERKWKSGHLQRERRKQEKDASSSNEAAHLQQKLKSLSTELVTLRNRLHVNNSNANANCQGSSSSPELELELDLPAINGRVPQVPPHHRSSDNGGTLPRNGIHHNYMNQPLPYPNKPLPPQPNGGYYENENFQKEVLRIGSDILGVSNCSGTNNNNNNNNINQNQEKLGVVAGISGLRDRDGNQSSSGSGGGSCVINSNAHSLILGSNSTAASASAATNGDVSPSESSYGKLSLSNKSSERAGKTSSNRRSVRSYKSNSNSNSKGKKSPQGHTQPNFGNVEDLINLVGPLTEDAIIRCIQARAAVNKYSIHTGPILLLTNRLTSIGNPLTLTSTIDHEAPPALRRVVQEALRQQGDSGYPQAIILSGVSGSGKTYNSMLILRTLFELAGGGQSSDAFRHLSASITVLRSLGTASTVLNRDSSRVGHFIEVQVTEGTVYRTKVHCYFLDQNRVVKCVEDEKNYDIFYQMLAGLSHEERERLQLGGHSSETLRYLRRPNYRTDEKEEARRFREWKVSLGMLGIPFLDVVRVLTAVILLGNVEFKESSSSEMEVQGELELASAASLLGVSESALKQGLTTRTSNLGALLRSKCSATACNFARDSLAKSLYIRTVATIVRRANSLKRLGSNSGTLSSDSADSVHNQMEVASQHASTVGTAGSKASKSMTALNNAVRQTTDGFIGILDMFGFEDLRPSSLEHLCINLTAETMQHFYNTHIFKAAVESCRDEGIGSEWELDYVDNVPCIDLISSLRTGILSLLDIECSLRGSPESFCQKMSLQHTSNPRLLISPNANSSRSFAIQHYAGKVSYDASDFLDTNRDLLSDDLVAAFHKHSCSFGFASHLFSSELKILGAGGGEPAPRGIAFRISPSSASASELAAGFEPLSTLTQDFHTRLDNLLRTLVHARPHFVRCIKLNCSEQPDLFDRHVVARQLRAFQVTETLNLMAHGYPHRMRFKAFCARYICLGPFHRLNRMEDRLLEDCHLILDRFDQFVSSWRGANENARISWAVGKRHIFLSEAARQKLESLRSSTRSNSATLIQSTWRGFHVRLRLPILRQRRFIQVQNPDIPPNLPPPNPPAAAVNPNLKTASNSPPPPPPIPSYFNNTKSGNSIAPIGIPLQKSPLPPIPHIEKALNSNSHSPPAAVTSLSPPIIPLPPALSTSSTAVINGAHSVCSSVNSNTNSNGGFKPRPTPISGTPPPLSQPLDLSGDKCDPKLVQMTCSIFGLDLERPPPLPPSRSYTVAGNTKMGYPQSRTMKMSYPDEGTPSEVRLSQGDSVTVLGNSSRRGHLLIETKNRTLHVPFQYLELSSLTSGSSKSTSNSGTLSSNNTTTDP